MQPSGGREETPHMGAVSLMFKHDVLALLPGAAAIDCRMRIFPVTADRVGAAEGEWTWHIDRDRQETELKIDNVTPGLKEFGACSEDKWPFSKALLLEQPNRDAYKEADKFKVHAERIGDYTISYCA